jgi:hypothetical protein
MKRKKIPRDIAEDAYSSMTLDPKFAFVGVFVVLHLILYLPFGL